MKKKEHKELFVNSLLEVCQKFVNRRYLKGGSNKDPHHSSVRDGK